jgi:cellulose synthase/poly-beta-1,6-N-acetylglucosamine synthase-like glycosyltransferase
MCFQYIAAHLLNCFEVLWIPIGLALLLGVLSLRGEGKRMDFVRWSLSNPEPSARPPATVIVPVKGEDEGLKENLAALASLDYPDYELIVAARSPEDIPAGVLPSSARVVYAGPGDPSAGEKVNNLLAAVRAARPESAIFAFADSDGRPGAGWLKSLVRSLEGEGVGAATGYRWFLPDKPTFWNLMRSVWNAVIAGGLGPGPNQFVWGGAMAIRRNVFFAAQVPQF